MNTEERNDAQQPRPRKIVGIRRENTEVGNDRRAYGQGYDRPMGNNYERRPYYRDGQDNRGGYGNNRPAYGGNREGGNGYGNNRPAYNNRPYNNRDGGYNSRPAYGGGSRPNYDRPYTPNPNNTEVEGAKKRRPRVGDNRVSTQQYDNNYYNNDNYSNNRNSYSNDNRNYGGGNRGGYNNDNRNYGGGDRRSYGNENRGGGYGNDNRGGYNNYDNRGGYGNDNRGGGYMNDNRRERPSYGNRNGGYDNKQRTPGYNPNNKYSKKKQLKYKEALTDPNEPIRLNKFLSNAGVCSRREADEYIAAGVVKVNDVVVTELGTKITRQDIVLFQDRQVQIESKLYVLLNKPKNCVTTSDDPQERLTVMDLVKYACKERIYPVGRLDRNTTGVLLLTNDGDMASKLTHPSFKKKKIYHVWLDKNVSIEDMEKIANGIELEDGEIHADAISYANEEDKSQVGVEIHSGRNRIVRRIFETLGYHVVKLDRVYFAGLTKKNLGRGKWRYLNEKEVNALRMGAFE